MTPDDFLMDPANRIGEKILTVAFSWNDSSRSIESVQRQTMKVWNAVTIGAFASAISHLRKIIAPANGNETPRESPSLSRRA
jgi:hypothetical protein